MTPLLLLSAYALGALLLASAAVPAVRRLALRAGLVDDPQDADYKTHSRATPCGGGLAIWVGACIPLGAAAAWLAAARPDLIHDGVGWIGPWAPYAFFPLESWSPTVREVSQVLCLLGAATAIMLLGLADDRRPLPPALRLGVQAALGAAIVLWVPGFRLAAPGGSTALAAVLSILWIVALTNAFNFLDNMDGLAAGLAVLGLGACAALALAAGHLPLAALCLASAGASGGFLVHNFPAASIFLGDAGGLLLGFLSGAVSVSLSSQLAGAATGLSAAPLLLLPLLPFGLPAYDLVTVVWLRLRRGAAPWVGDNRHVSHRLVAAGFDRTRAVLLLHALTAALALPCAAAAGAGPAAAWWAVLGGLAWLLLLGAAEIALARRRRGRIRSLLSSPETNGRENG